MTTTNSHDLSETTLEAAPALPETTCPAAKQNRSLKRPASNQRKQPPVYLQRKVHVLLLAVLLISVLAFLAWASTEADEGDVIVASANSSQNSHSATLLNNGNILVAGGWSGTAAIANADLFDADARTWAAAAPLLTPRIFHAATRLSDGRVLVTGGWDHNGDILTSAEIYDPVSAAWLSASPLRDARAGHAALTLPDGRVLVVGGCVGSQASGATSSAFQPWDVQRTVEVYDPRVNSWQAAGQLAEGRCWPTATLLADGRVLVVGGSDRNGQPVAGAELYDPDRNSWSSAGRLSVAREGHTATLLPNGQVLVAGGYNAEVLTSTELYNPVANTWTAAASMRQARAYHTAALLQNGKVLAIGGATSSFPSQDTEAYHSESNTWTPAGPLPAPYAFHLTTVLANGRVVVTGRPGSNDPTGNDGYPTPMGGAQTPTPRGTPGIPQHLANPSSGGTMGSQGMSVVEGGEGTTPTPLPTPTGNVTYDTGTARLYGVHEVSFTLPTATASPYGLSYSITFTAQDDSATTVKAFYDGPSGSQDRWVARVYVNRVGTWTWSLAPGATCPASSCTFTAIDQPGYAQLHGMLRVTSGNEGKRWYTDDGQTFLPKADTAYRLFMEVPASPQTGCPIGNLPMATPAAADSFVAAYAGSAHQHGINVLRALALGNWAYSNTDFPTPTPRVSCAAEDWKCQHFVNSRLDDCLPDLSLYFSNDLNGSSNNLFDGGPEYAQIQTGFYPNLESFQRTDRKLKLLLNQYPSMYIQVLLVTEPYRNNRDTQWLEINTTLRTQLWQNMIARWAAFPNIFWSISNDLGDVSSPTVDPWWNVSYNNNVALANEIGCYWMGGSACTPQTGNDPWRASRPMSMGHLRQRTDSSINKSWHTYITSYTNADTSAQEMDGSMNLPLAYKYEYAAIPKPVYNTEDMFEAADDTTSETNYKVVKYANYFFRKLFWSYLLSGGGATYGSDTTWSMEHEYDGGTYYIPPPVQVITSLVGLDSIGFIDPILRQARIDLASFTPSDQLILQTISPPAWAEVERAQVASNDQEILAYIPSTDPNNISTPTPGALDRRQAREITSTTKNITVDMTDYSNPSYRVTWYEPTTGQVLNTGTIPGNSGPGSYRPTLTPPPNAGDVVLHISSRCEYPHACQPMDTAPPTSPPNPTGTPEPGFYVGADHAAQVVLDNSHSALGYSNTASWRCERPPTETGVPGCWVKYIIPPVENEGMLASADFYFRRNSNSAYLWLTFSPLSTYDPGDPIQSGEGVEMPIGGTLSIVFYPEGDLETFGDIDWIPSQITPNVIPDLNRWYHLSVKVTRTGVNTYNLDVYLDGVLIQARHGLHFHFADPNFRRVEIYTSWWGPTTDLPAGSTPAVWWDELSISPPPPGASAGMHRTDFQQGLAGYTGNHVAYIGGGSGYNNTALLKVGANNNYKTLLWFNTSSLPPQAVVDEATLELYYTGRDNGNTLTLGAHRVLAEWIDSEVTHFQRKAGSNWVVAGMGSGSDYTALPEATLPLGNVASGWVQLDLTAAVQAWVANHANNHGLVLLQEAASGWVTYQFCSELGWTPCTPGQAPRLVIRYHLEEPKPEKATFQQGTGGYSGTNATCLAYSSSNNECALFKAGANDGLKSLVRFDLASIPTGKTVEEATLRLYYKGRSNSNDLTIGAYRLLAPWVDSQATWTQRMTGVNWVAPGLGSGSDYAATGGGASAVLGDGGSWVEIDVTEMAQAWVDSPAQNYGLLLRQASAAGYVIYDFCSERGVSPCSPGQTPQLTVWYR